ncbi:YheT family hydrolase [Flexithrix dorotheae]|uniref:YheT family hydrolase n=1 Tax=Flexithrix dorotheae TaxID=70993 RepID=UPI0003718C00|nr:alpha/beta fold hydrolase [Flexithrix dorotheae]
MPVIHRPKFTPPIFLRNNHLHTIFPVLFRKVKDVNYVRERLNLKDGDFIDLDWQKNDSKKVALLIHGFEGSTDSLYLKAMAHAMLKSGWDIVGMNLRGCSGELNHLYRSYHSGASEDVEEVVNYLANQYNYEELMVIGFSLGGNMTLKYLGEAGKKQSPDILKSAVAVSVPCDLGSAADTINRFYANRFLKTLKPKLIQKIKKYSSALTIEDVKKIKTLREFDDIYTAPVHGYENATDFYSKCSSRHFIKNIEIPTLLISALDDPFLTKKCFPFKEAQQNPNFYFLATQNGGHVGFVEFNADGEYWLEKRIVDFASNKLSMASN